MILDVYLAKIYKKSWFLLQIIKNLHKHLHPVNLEYAHVAELPDFVGVQQLHSSGAFVEVVAEGDAAAPVLYFAGTRPEG